jgi:hypothetical protein
MSIAAVAVELNTSDEDVPFIGVTNVVKRRRSKNDRSPGPAGVH